MINLEKTQLAEQSVELRSLLGFFQNGYRMAVINAMLRRVEDPDARARLSQQTEKLPMPTMEDILDLGMIPPSWIGLVNQINR